MSYTFQTKIHYFKDHTPGDSSFSCDFVITHDDGSTVNMHYTEPYLCKSDEWTDLIDNLFTPAYRKRLTFCDCNGCVSVGVNNGNLQFHTSKSGSGGDGSFTNTIRPTPQVQEELRKVVEAFAN